ncbi:MAG TPA: rhodanese-like domain-containing protein [Chitinophagaceae bacterium]|nr:rhodanese-like domain-containing protein [Chitinophagaceae bacterium]
MKSITLLLTLLLGAGVPEAQKTTQTIYKCLPCGYECDKATYTSPGKCEHCQMALVPASTITFKEVSPADICKYISRHPQTVLLDVRTKTEYEGKANPDFGTLRNSINIPIQELEQRISELEKYKGREILVFCSHSHRSPQAAYMLTQRGFNKVVNMSGGMSVLQDTNCKK